MSLENMEKKTTSKTKSTVSKVTSVGDLPCRFSDESLDATLWKIAIPHPTTQLLFSTFTTNYTSLLSYHILYSH